MFVATLHVDETLSFKALGDVTWESSAGKSLPKGTLSIPKGSIAWESNMIPKDGAFVVEVETEVGLWRGFADVPVWDDSGVTITIHGSEKWLSSRRVSPSKVFYGVSAGVIFRQAITDAMLGLSPIPITIGTVLEAGPIIGEMIFAGQSCLDVLKELSKATGHDWYIDDRNRIHWAERIGRYHEEWCFDDGLLLNTLQLMPLDEMVSEHIEVEKSGRSYATRTAGRPVLWPLQDVEKIS